MDHGNQIDGMASDDQYRDSPETDTDKKEKKLSLRCRLKSSILNRRSRSATPSSDDSRQSSADHSKSKLRNLLSRRSKTPDNVSENTTENKTSAQHPISGKVRRSGVSTVNMPLEGGGMLDGYEPPLSPIKGTPTHKARPPQDEVDSGLGKMSLSTNRAEGTIMQPSAPIKELPLEDEVVFSKKAVGVPRRETITGKY